MTPSERTARFDALRARGCICCLKNLADDVADGGDYLATAMYVEIHHLNGGGHHGQKRRGDEYTIALCPWHHRGQGPSKAYRQLYGPSWAKGSKPFRAVYGTDDELLALANRLIGVGIA